MIPRPFELHSPSTLSEATSLLKNVDDSKALAGGQSLVPLMKLRLVSPANIVDLGKIPGLSYIREEKRPAAHRLDDDSQRSGHFSGGQQEVRNSLRSGQPNRRPAGQEQGDHRRHDMPRRPRGRRPRRRGGLGRGAQGRRPPPPPRHQGEGLLRRHALRPVSGGTRSSPRSGSRSSRPGAEAPT